MKVWKLIVIGFLGASAAYADEITERMDAAPDGTVEISNVAGSVEVRGWSRNEVEVVADLGSRVEELIFERDDNNILIRVEVPRHSNGGISSDLFVKVPQGSALIVDTVSADIDVADVEGEQKLQAVSGDVSTEAHGEDIELGSVSGDVEVEGDNNAARSKLNTVSGDVDAENLSGEVQADSVSGDVTIVGGSFERSKIETVNGDIVLHSGFEDGGRLDIETVNGSVDVDFGGDISARIDIETFNGSIRNCFGPESVRTSRYTPGRELNFTEGDGSGRISIQTLNGSVRLCK